MLEIKKSGSTEYGVWVIGTLNLGSLVISGIFSTNLSEIPTEKSLKVKLLKISTNKKGFPVYRVEF